MNGKCAGKKTELHRFRSIFILHPMYAEKAGYHAGPLRVLSAHHVDGIIFCFLIFLHPYGNWSACIFSRVQLIVLCLSVYYGHHISVVYQSGGVLGLCQVLFWWNQLCNWWLMYQTFLRFRWFLDKSQPWSISGSVGNCNWNLYCIGLWEGLKN